MLLTHEVRKDWSIIRKVFFRFIFLYFILYIFLMFGGRLLESLFVWIGQTIFKSEGRLEFFSTGSGDTTMSYISLFLQVVITVIGTALWSFLDRKRPSYNQLFYWFLIILRIFLIAFMFFYGFVKIFKLQFIGPSLLDLLQPLGEMSPMGLAWTYMGHSEGFNVFVGCMEVLGGILLIPRRTQTLGAFITIGVMTQVAMMNFFYDIPVKLFSSHLIGMACVIFFSDIKRFIHLFITNQPTQALTYYTPSKDVLYKKIILWVKIVATIGFIAVMSWQGYTSERSYGDKRPKPELYGIWEVQTFIKNKDTLPPLITDSLRWRYLVIDRKNSASVKMMDGEIKRYTFTLDSLQKTVTMYEGDWEQENNFSVTKSEDKLRLEGILYGDTLSIECVAKDLSKIELINRGFHWVNEQPYNK